MLNHKSVSIKHKNTVKCPMSPFQPSIKENSLETSLLSCDHHCVDVFRINANSQYQDCIRTDSEVPGRTGSKEPKYSEHSVGHNAHTICMKNDRNG